VEFKLNEIDKTKQEVEFEIPYADLAPYFEKGYKKYQKKVEVPGFRKGKAPLSMLKRMYGDMIEQGSLEDVANDVFRDYLKENHVHPISEGALTDLNYEPKGTFTFKIVYEVLPEFELSKYKDFEVSKTVYNTDDKTIDDEIKYLRAKNSIYEETDKSENNESVITMDVQRLDDTGIPIIGEHDKDVKFYLNDSQMNPDLKEQLKDSGVGEERVLTLKNPDGHEEKYKAKATKIEKVILPELNEEFFKKIYKDEIKDETGFRNKIKSDLEGIYKNVSEQELRNNIVNELIKLNEIPVPDAMVENILNTYIDDLKNKDPKRKLPPDFDVEEFRKTKRVEAILQVKWYLIRDKILHLEKIEVMDDDLEPLIEEDAKKYNIPADKIRSIYEKNEDVKYKLLDKKLLDFLIANANIKEVEKKDEPQETE